MNSKKMSLMLTLFVFGAMILAACGSSNSVDNGLGTPAVESTLPAGGDATGLETPATGLETETTGMETPTTGIETPAAGLDTTATVATTSESTDLTTATPETSTGVTPQASESGQYVLLSSLLKMSVNSQDGQAVGNVNGVVIDRQAGTASDAVGVDAVATATPATTGSTGSDATATATPAAGNASSDSGTVTNIAGSAPRISFVLVNLTGQGASSDTGSSTLKATATVDPNTSAGTATATPGTTTDNSSNSTAANGSQVLVPFSAFTVSSSSASTMGDMALTLSVDASTLASAPAFSESDFAGTVGDDVTAYWSGEGLNIPATGGTAAETGSSMLVRGQIGSIQVMGMDGKSFGQVRDFVVDTTTGELVYAILGGGSTAAGDLYVVPFSVLNWDGSSASSASANSLGDFSLNVENDRFTSAPTIKNVDELDFSMTDWQSQFDTFWSTTK
jgi:sporulation protein YlmC with PRC-barrel domain